MVSVVYNKLFNTRIRHTFYANGNGKNDLVIKPTTLTQMAMQNTGMVFKTDDEGFRVYYKMNGSNPFVPIDNTRLVFGLQLRDIGFLNYTALNDGVNPYTSGKIAYFTNKAVPTAALLVYSLLDQLQPAVFTYQFTTPTSTGAGHIQIKDEAGVDITPALPDPNNIPGVNRQYAYPVDFSDKPAGIYTFKTWVGTDAPVTQTVYISNELAAQGVFGILDIVVNNQAAFPMPGRAYDMQFGRRTSQWKYYVVLQSGSHGVGENIGIADDGGAQAPYPAITFNPSTNGTVNGIDTKIITSIQTDLPFFETPKQKLSVVQNPGGSAIKLKQNIAGPAPSLVSAPKDNIGITEIFVYI